MQVDRELCRGWKHGSLSECAEVHFGAVRLTRSQRLAAVIGQKRACFYISKNTGGTAE